MSQKHLYRAAYKVPYLYKYHPWDPATKTQSLEQKEETRYHNRVVNVVAGHFEGAVSKIAANEPLAQITSINHVGKIDIE